MSELSVSAWWIRKHARIARPDGTKVGCAVQLQSGAVFMGCNLEHGFRSHDIHAEIAALSAVASQVPSGSISSILIAAERERFTPCGACLDWIFELGGTGTRIIHERRPGVVTLDVTAADLMPYYPL